MKKQMTKLLKLAMVMVGIFMLASCSITNRSIQEQNSLLRLVHDDFNYSEQVVGEAQTVRVLGVDWKRLFKKGEFANGESMNPGIDLASLPIVGNVLHEKTYNLALYQLLNANPGYDIIMYPQYEMTKKGFPGIFTRTTVKATARLAKIKK